MGRRSHFFFYNDYYFFSHSSVLEWKDAAALCIRQMERGLESQNGAVCSNWLDTYCSDIACFSDFAGRGIYGTQRYYTNGIVPPEPDFEKKPFAYVVRSVHMPVDLVLARLRSLGLNISDDQESLQDIAKKNNSTPQAVYMQIIHLSVE